VRGQEYQAEQVSECTDDLAAPKLSSERHFQIVGNPEVGEHRELGEVILSDSWELLRLALEEKFCAELHEARRSGADNIAEG
jgi:hypothetical protein